MWGHIDFENLERAGSGKTKVELRFLREEEEKEFENAAEAIRYIRETDEKKPILFGAIEAEKRITFIRE